MQIPATPDEARAILGAMLTVASAGGGITDADRASVAAAARYIFRLDGSGLTPASPPDTALLLANKPELAKEAVRFATVLAFVGIGLAAFFFLQRPEAADGAARSLAPLHRLLLNKYYVDEIYDAAIVHPLRDGSSSVLWKTVDARIIDGAVNGTGHLVRESAGALRLLQTGSVRVYAASLFTGALLVLGYFLAR